MIRLPLILFSLLLANQLWGQGRTVKENGHHLATLELFGNFQNAKYKISNTNISSGINNAGIYKYTKNNIAVSGLVKSAALVMDWWLLFGEPTENYIFKWYTSNYYFIEYKSKTGALVTKNIEREKLAKYPDLIKRFDALAPLDISFEIKWSLGYPSDEDWQAFKNKYGITGNIGVAIPNINTEYTSLVNREFTTRIKNGLLFEASGVEPLAVPSIRQGKGLEFLGLAADFNQKELTKIFNFWNLTSTLNINNFKILKMDWPVGEMKEIAEKFEAYEKGDEPTPKQEIAKADEKNKTLPTYNKNDFWGDAVEEGYQALLPYVDKNTNRIGFKNKNGNIIIPAIGNAVVVTNNPKDAVLVVKSTTTSNENFIFDNKGNEIEKINNKGQVWHTMFATTIPVNSKDSFKIKIAPPYFLLRDFTYEKWFIYSLRTKKIIYTAKESEKNYHHYLYRPGSFGYEAILTIQTEAYVGNGLNNWNVYGIKEDKIEFIKNMNIEWNKEETIFH